VGYDHAEPGEKREMVAMTKRLVRAAPLPNAPKRRPKPRGKLKKGLKK
jgi:ssRNA-specific RNase YbeY (16S rRNA maturation enzyme)